MEIRPHHGGREFELEGGNGGTVSPHTVRTATAPQTAH
jgi:hypothetical protein